MAFTFTNSRGVTYTLHRKQVTTRSGSRLLHYFGREAGPEAIDKIPAGYTVVEAASGMPVLKKQA